MMAQEPATTDELNYSHRLVAGAFQEILLGSKPGCAALLLTHRGETAPGAAGFAAGVGNGTKPVISRAADTQVAACSAALCVWGGTGRKEPRSAHSLGTSSVTVSQVTRTAGRGTPKLAAPPTPQDQPHGQDTVTRTRQRPVYPPPPAQDELPSRAQLPGTTPGHTTAPEGKQP